MSSFLDTVESQFGSKNLYIVLGVEKSASENELRRAYHRLSLKVHPDRAEPEEVDQATQKFQVRVVLVVYMITIVAPQNFIISQGCVALML